MKALPTQRRLRWSRRRLLLLSVLPLVLILLVAAKFMSVGILAEAAVSAFDQRDSTGVAAAALGLQVANGVEPYKAVFAEGDALVVAGDAAAARGRFEHALDLGAGKDECKVRVNLVLTIEQLGSAAAEPAAGRALLGEALAVVGQSPQDCFSNPGNGSGRNDAGEGGRLQEARDRLTKALGDLDETGPSGGDDQEMQGEEQADPARDSALEQLQQNARDAARDRVESEARNNYLDESGSGPGVDRPW